MKNSNDTIGNRTRDLLACSAVPQPSPRAPLLILLVVVVVVVAVAVVVTIIIKGKDKCYCLHYEGKQEDQKYISSHS